MAIDRLPLRRKTRLKFWLNWLNPGGPYPEARSERLREGRPLPDWAVAALPDEGGACKILDVNAGPLTALGTVADGYTVTVTPVDDLAFHFDRELERLEITPPVRTRQCAPEDVRARFGQGSFDLIYSFNGLDHTSDPVAVYGELLACLKEGGRIITFHETTDDIDRMHREAYRYFHVIRDGRLVLRKKSRCWDLLDALPGADLETTQEGSIIRVEITSRKEEERPRVKLPARQKGKRALPALISLHIPKSGGSSFRDFLRSLYGEAMRPMYTSEETAPRLVHKVRLEPGTSCLHGHFQADAFDHLLPGALKITWLRDPVERVVSGYYQFLRHPDTADESDFNRDFFESGMSLMEFARHENIRDSLFWYLNAVPLEDFFFVGITERYMESMKLFCHLMNIPPPREKKTVNTNPEKQGMRRYTLSPAQRSELEGLYALEIEMYRLARYRLDEELRLAFG